jgi:serine/threonine-protein kinase
VDRFDSELIPGTDGAFLPFFSPDGRWVAFNQGGVLQKMPADGGLPVAILRDAGDLSGGAVWGSDGRIVFTRGLGNGGLWSVSENGGEPVQLTQVSEKDNETQHMWPDVLPGGALLYTVLGPSGHAHDARLVVEDPATRTRTIVASGMTYGRYLDTGHLAYVDGTGSLLLQPFDPVSRRTTGAARPVLSVRSATWGGGAAFAIASNGTLVYATGTELQGYRLVELDRAGMERRQFGMPAAFGFLTPSPNGRTLALIIRSATNDDVHLVDVASGQIDRFSFGVAEDESPVWSPDGRQIAYSAAGTGARRHIYVKTVGSTESERLLYTGERHLHLTSWSPDGKWLAFHEIGPGFNDVVILNLEDPSKTLKLARAAGAMFSPDGKWLAYSSSDPGELFVVSFPDLGGKQQLSRRGRAANWSKTGPTGFELYFVSFEGPKGTPLMAAPAVARDGAISFRTPYELFDVADIEIVPALDARSFFAIVPNPDSPARELHVVTNWLAEVLATNPSEGR